MPLFRSRQQQRMQQQMQTQQPLEQLRSTDDDDDDTNNICAASLEGLVEASSRSVSLSASGLCRCGLGGEEVHSVQVRRERRENWSSERFFSFAKNGVAFFFQFRPCSHSPSPHL